MTVLDPEAAARSTSLVTLLSDVLEASVTALEAAGVTVPARRYYCLGEPAVDCEQLVVSFVQAYIGPPGDEASAPRHCDSPLTAALAISLWRRGALPDNRGNPPTAAAVAAAADKTLTDAYVLLDAACSLDRWDSAAGGRGLGVIATVDAQGMQGEYQGAVLNLTLAIP